MIFSCDRFQRFDFFDGTYVFSASDSIVLNTCARLQAPFLESLASHFVHLLIASSEDLTTKKLASLLLGKRL